MWFRVMEDLLVSPGKICLPRLWIGYNRNKCHLNFSKTNKWPAKGKVLERKEWEEGTDLQNLGKETGIMETKKTEDKALAQTFAYN